MDLMRHSTNTHGSSDFAHHYGPLDFNGNHHHDHHGHGLEHHNAYWQWQHSDGSSSDGFGHHRRPAQIHSANDRHILHRWDAASDGRPPQAGPAQQQDADEFTTGLLHQSPPPYRPKDVADWNRSCFGYVPYV